MAVKKTELYSSLWASCDALRGGMDASQYKDYILTLLFMKYVTDKYKGQKYGDLTVFDKANDPNPDPEKRTGCSFDDFIALKNKKNIGEGIDKIIARLAEVNEGLKGVIDIAHFNDEAKIGKDKEMVDKLTKLIAIFQRPELDFSKNKAERLKFSYNIACKCHFIVNFPTDKKWLDFLNIILLTTASQSRIIPINFI